MGTTGRRERTQNDTTLMRALRRQRQQKQKSEAIVIRASSRVADGYASAVDA
jgi:hypothetical protein